MSDQRKQQLVEQYEDLALSMLMEDYAEEEGKRLLREFEEAERNGEIPEIPAALDQKCRAMIDASFAKQKQRQRRKKILSMAAKAAIFVVAFLGLSTITILSVDALRIPVLNFLMDQSGRYSTVVYNNNLNAETPDENPVLSHFESNLPKGYYVFAKDLFDSHFTIICSNNNNDSIYLQSTETNCGLTIDAEVTEYRDLDFAGYEAVFWEKEGYCLMWLDDQTQTVYTLLATGLDENEFWEFAYTLTE